MSDQFDAFLESLHVLPPELRRNLILVSDLDKKTGEIYDKLYLECYERYKKTKSKMERAAIRREVNTLFEKLIGLADDKINLMSQSYESIDKSIDRLQNTRLVQKDDKDQVVIQAPIVNMPVDPNEPKYCTCNGVSVGTMVACDNKDCLIQWFHFECVGISAAPKGKWYCQDCSSQMFVKRQSASKSRVKKRRR